jgi:hypothetical protein
LLEEAPKGDHAFLPKGILLWDFFIKDLTTSMKKLAMI